MSKQEVYNIMRSNPNKIYTIYDLIKLVNINMSSLSLNLKKLRLDNFINCISKKVKGVNKNYYWYGENGNKNN